LLKIIKFIFNRKVLFIFLCCAVVVWAIYGLKIVRKVSGPHTTREFAEEQIERLRSVNPEAAVGLTRLMEKHDARAVAVSIRAARVNGNLSGLRELAEQAKKIEVPYQIQLVEMAAQEGLFNSEEERDGFFIAHASACQLLVREQSSEALSYYLDQLKQASKNKEAWRVIKDDPAAMVLWPYLRDNFDLWQYYEKERDWLAEQLVVFEPINEDYPEERGKSLTKLVELAYRYHPLVKSAVVDENLGIVGFSLFLAYGSIIAESVSVLGLPLGETLEVIFANMDSFETDDEMSVSPRGKERAEELFSIYKNKPNVWQHARLYPLALRLNRDAPNYADALLREYGHDDITYFLYASYENEKEIPIVAEAIVKFGDLAIYILNRYADDPDFHKYLLDRRLGVRLIPFVVRFEDEGLEKIEDNIGWVDRYFNPDGTPKRDKYEWVETIPIAGGPLKVVANWKQGHPCTWGELGWAALDVADGALLVVSLGSSSGLTALKQGVKQGTKQTMKFTSKKSMQFIPKADIRKAARNIAKNSAQDARQIARSVKKVPRLRRYVEVVWGTAKKMGKGVKYTYRIGSKYISKAGEKVYSSAKRIKNSWHSVQPKVRKWTYRALLGVGLFITINERTIPGLPLLGEEIGRFVGRLLRNIGEAQGRVLAAAFKELLFGGSSFSKEWDLAIFGVIMVILGIMTYRFRPKLGSRYHRI